MNKKQNIVVIGAGYWGSNILKNLQELGVLYGYVDQFVQHPNIPSFNIEEALRDPQVTGVMIATPSNTHTDVIRQCLEHQKHVFVEKPICLSLKEADELTALAAEKKLILMIGYLMMFHPITQTIKQLIHEGPLKDCSSILIQRQAWQHPRCFESIWWDLCVHDISMLHAIFGQVPTHQNMITHQLPGRGFDTLHYQGTLSHPAGHTISVQLSSSWLAPTKSTYWTFCTPEQIWTYQNSSEFEIKGQSLLDRNAPLQFINTEETRPLKLECEHFIECIERLDTPTTSHSNTREVMVWLDSLESFNRQQ